MLQRSFRDGRHALSAVDDITSMEGSIFVSWQNGVGPKGEPAGNGNTQSTIAQYSSSGYLINSWQLTGRCDGLTADSQHDRIIATVNEDGNSSLAVIKPDAPKASQLVHYTYSPNATAARRWDGCPTHLSRADLYQRIQPE